MTRWRSTTSGGNRRWIRSGGTARCTAEAATCGRMNLARWRSGTAFGISRWGPRRTWRRRGPGQTDATWTVVSNTDQQNAAVTDAKLLASSAYGDERHLAARQPIYR